MKKNYQLPAEINSGSTNKDWISLATLTILWIAMTYLVAPVGNYPLNDDWVYGQTVKTLLSSGNYYFHQTSSANVGPQIFWGALFCLPFGFSFTALRFSTLVAGLIAILVLYYSIRRVHTDFKIAFIGAALLASNPIFFSLSNTFMTDVPFVTIVVITLFFFIRGFQTGSRRDLLIGLFFGIMSVLVRQVGLITLVGFSIAYPIRFRLNARSIFRSSLTLAIGIATHVLYQYWLIHTGRTPVLSGHSNVQQLLNFSGRGWYIRQTALSIVVYSGFFVLPLLLFLRPLKMALHGTINHPFKLIAVFAMLFTLMAWWKGLAPPLMGNLVNIWGIGPLTLRDTYMLEINLPKTGTGPFWATYALGFAAVVSVFLITVFILSALYKSIRSAKSTDHNIDNALTWLLVGAFASYAAVLILMSCSLPMMDRYILPCVPILILAISKTVPADIFRSRVLLTASGMMIASFAIYSVCGTHDYMEWNRLRWIATQELMANNVAASQIDGGYEFNGSFTYNAHYVALENKSWWWVDQADFQISSGPVEGYRPIRKYEFTRWLSGEHCAIFVLKKTAGT